MRASGRTARAGGAARGPHGPRGGGAAPVSRRTALKALGLPAVTGLTGLGAAGCGGPAATVNVAVVWTGWELRQFQRVMNRFARDTGIGYQLLSMGDDTGAFLGNDVTGAAQPDVALVPAPGTVLGNRGRLVPVAWPRGDAPSWRRLLAGPGGAEYGVWYKAAYESMVWHTDAVTAPPGGWDTWDAWTAWCAARASAGHPPLAIGAADGWVLADWFANVLLSLDPGTYTSLAAAYRDVAADGGASGGTGPSGGGTSGTGADGTGPSGGGAGAGRMWHHPSVAESLSMLADLWRIPGLFPGGAERALATQFDQSVLDVFASGDAAMVAGADYYWPVITQSTRFPPPAVRWFPFPAAATGQSPVVIGGDAAVLFRRPDGQRHGRRLLEWLRSPDAARIWAAAGGFLSINDQVTMEDYRAYPRQMQVPRLLASVRQLGAQFDMADVLSGPLAGGDGEGSWKIFTDFFTDVAVRRVAPGTAVEAAVTALSRGEGGA